MKNLLLHTCLLLSSFSIRFAQDSAPPDLSEAMQKKHQLILQALQKKGLADRVGILSAARSEQLNKLLPLSADKSFHLKGMAIDYWVGDLNADGKANGQDVDIFCTLIRSIERKYPKLTGGLGTYKGKWYGRQMVHTDVRGYQAAWNK